MIGSPTSAVIPPTVPLGLAPRRESGLSTSLGLWLSGMVDVARDSNAPRDARDRARTALREVARLATLACEAVRVANRAENAEMAKAAAANRAAQTRAVLS